MARRNDNKLDYDSQVKKHKTIDISEITDIVIATDTE